MCLDLVCGFCSISEGRVITAFRAMASRSDSVAKLLKRRVSSVTNCLPHAPDGTLKFMIPVNHFSIRIINRFREFLS